LKNLIYNFTKETFPKILESIIKDRLEEQLKKTQNSLQRGFTEKAYSKFTAFITAERIALYKKLNMELEVFTYIFCIRG
jgi:hypothetical protein